MNQNNRKSSWWMILIIVLVLVLAVVFILQFVGNSKQSTYAQNRYTYRRILTPAIFRRFISTRATR